MQIFSVTAKCGHVGKDFYIPITFAIRAENGREAAAIVRQKPRVKHHHKDAIIDVKRISETEEREINYQNRQDPYLQCNNIQEQRAIIDQIVSRIMQETVANQGSRIKNCKRSDSKVTVKHDRVSASDLWNEYLSSEDAYAS